MIAFIGLGNPGNEFVDTKHNAGYWVIDELARRWECNFMPGTGDYVYAKNTGKEIDRVNKARKQEEVADKDRMHKMEQEKLFQAKIAAFEMDVVRNTNHREMKSKIRRSKTIMELTAYVGAIIALENINGEATD